MNSKYLILLMLVLIIPMASASLGTFKQSECVPIRVLANCSNVDLIEVTSNNQTFIINSPMSNLGGQTFNYTFCNTNTLGQYTYSWNNPCIDCSQGECGNDFTVTPTGNTNTSSLWLFAVLLVFSIIILCMAFGMQNEYIGFISGTLFMVTGVYSMIYGIGNISDTWTQMISYIIIGLGFIFNVAAGYSVISGLGLFKMGVDPNEF